MPRDAIRSTPIDPGHSHPLWVIPVGAEVDPSSLGKSLTHEEANLIRVWYCSSRTGANQLPILDLLRSLWTGRQWIVCGCQRHQNQFPLLFIRRSLNGTMTLVHMNGRAHHAHDCVFSESTSRNPTPEKFGSSGTEQRLSGLSKVFSEIVQQAELDCILPDAHVDHKLRHQFKKLRIAAGAVLTKRGIHPGTPIGTFIGQYEEIIKETRLVESFSKGSFAAQGFLFLLSNKVSANQVELHVRHERFGALMSVSQDTIILGRAKNGPFLTLVILDPDTSITLDLQASRAIALPIVNLGRLFPVLEDYQRSALRRLINLQNWIYKSHGIVIRVSSGMFSQAQGEYDFIVTIVEPGTDRTTSVIKISIQILGESDELGSAFNNPRSDHINYLVRPANTGGYYSVADKAFGRLFIAKVLANTGQQPAHSG